MSAARRQTVARGNAELARNAVRFFSRFREQTFAVNWAVTNRCNYSCSYCPNILHDGSVPPLSPRVARGFVERLLAHCRRKENDLHVELSGGEPGTFKPLPNVLRQIKSYERRTHILMISNGSMPLSWWERNRELVDEVNLSFHTEFVDAEHFFRVAEFLSSHTRPYVHVNVMMLPSRFDEALEQARRLRDELPVGVTLKRLLVDIKHPDPRRFPYTPSQLALMDNFVHSPPGRQGIGSYDLWMTDESGNDHWVDPGSFLNRASNYWRGWKCHAGHDQICIGVDGRVFRGWCQQGGPIGHVADFQFRTRPVRCETPVCHCMFDFYATKERPAPTSRTSRTRRVSLRVR